MANESERANTSRAAGSSRRSAGSKSASEQEPSVAQPLPEPTRDSAALPRNGRPQGTPPPVTNTVSHLPSEGDREARRRRVAEAAYYRAQRRGFSPGGEVDDWLEAEREIESSESGTDT
jgi:hypothetical protein